MAGGATAQAGREMPLTSRSVMIRISPMIVTKMSVVPSLGSIGEAWVRMCSMPEAHCSAYCAYHGAPLLGLTSPSASEHSSQTRTWVASTVPPPIRRRRSTMLVPPTRPISSQPRIR